MAYPSNGIACVYCNSFFIQFLVENPDVPTFAVSHDQQYSVIKTSYADVTDGELEIGLFSPDSHAYAIFEIQNVATKLAATVRSGASVVLRAGAFCSTFWRVRILHEVMILTGRGGAGILTGCTTYEPCFRG